MLAKHIQAFTLIEILVSLILTSFVLMIAGLGMNILVRQFSIIKNMQEATLTTAQLKFVLKKDFKDALEIKMNNEKEIIITKDTSKVRYKIESRSLVRFSSAAVDTFKVNILSCELYFENKRILDEKLIDYVRIEIDVANKIHFLNFVKQYSAQQLLKSRD
jgi:type II secretory pathway pseudopilin PulG